MRIWRFSMFFIVVTVGFGCGQRSNNPEQAPTRSGGKTEKGTRSKSVTPTQPVSVETPSGCMDPVLLKLFGELTSCNFKNGVIDYQCSAWKEVHKKIRARERQNQALVQLSLMKLLSNQDDRVRLVAAKSLASYAQQLSVVKHLVDRFKIEKSAFVRLWIIHSLHNPSPKVVQTVLAALQSDPSPKVRARAAQRLSGARYGKNPQVAGALTKALKSDKDPEVRKRAVESLGNLSRDPKTEQLLVSLLSDPKIGPHSAIGLGRMGSKAGYEALLKILTVGRAQHRVHPLFVWSLMDFVGRPFFRAAAARSLLVAIAKDEKMPAGARHYAVKSLGRLARRMAGVRKTVMADLKALSVDKKLTISVEPTLKQVQQMLIKATAPRPRVD